MAKTEGTFETNSRGICRDPEKYHSGLVKPGVTRVDEQGESQPNGGLPASHPSVKRVIFGRCAQQSQTITGFKSGSYFIEPDLYFAFYASSRNQIQIQVPGVICAP